FLRERGWRRDPYSRQFISWKQTAQWLRISLKCALVRWAGGRGNDLFLGNSTAVAQDIQRLFPKKKTAVIKTAIDTNVFRPTLKKEQANSSGTFQLLYAGRINPPKGIGLLFHCLQQLHKEGVDFRLKIIGQYWPFEKEWFENMSAHYEADQYTDYIPRLPREELIPELSSADLLVLPSLYEGSPRIVKEALACGTQVLCTDIPGTHVLDPKGDILHFFQENNASDFLEKLRALMAQKGSEEWNQRIRSGVEWVRSYSHQQVSQQLIDLYEQILQIRKHESIH
ncbi:MAG: glycosyltransferase family 4 protein, partial [Bacteroidota bacterium]